MKTLQEIAQEAPNDDLALAAVREYTFKELKPIIERMMTTRGIAALIGRTAAKNFISAIRNSPDMDEDEKSWILPESGGVDVTNQDVIDTINEMVIATIITEAEATILKENGYVKSTPYSDKTLHDVKLIRGSMDFQDVILDSDGYVTIHTTTDCELHNPRLMALNPRTSKWQRVSSFYGVSAARAYDCKVPSEWRSAQLKVDDVYGVIS